MNTVLDEAKSLAADVAAAAKTADGVDVAVCVPFPFLTAVGDVLADSKVGLGAQDCYYEESGAYTAAVSTSMLKSVGTQYVLSGHSERRATFGDSDADVNKKTLKILSEGLKCILCIGKGATAPSNSASIALDREGAGWQRQRQQATAGDSKRQKAVAARSPRLLLRLHKTDGCGGRLT